MDKTLLMVMVVLALGILTIGSALAQSVPVGAQIDQSIDLGQTADLAAGSVSLEAGNIMNANLSTNQSTVRWAGLFGNASGTLRLGDAAGFTMYSWFALGRVIYATTSAAPVWASFADANEAAVVGAYSWLTTGVSDAYDTTFDNVAEAFNSEIFEGLTSDYALTYDDTGAETWKTYSFTDGVNIIFAGLVSPGGTAYSGQPADYQMIIPEDGTDMDATPTSWDLYIELI